MAHELLFEDGEAAMFYAGKAPWHGLGTKLENPATAEEAICAAKLDWEVRKIPLCAVSEGITRVVNGKYAIVPSHRWKDPVCPIFGTVSTGYTPLQNRDAFRFFDPIVGEGAAIYHTAGALGDGERVWMLAKLPDDIQVAVGDISNKYLLLSNSHDGRSSVQIKFTPVRVVCNNTLVQALGSGETIRVSHTSDLRNRLDIARQNLRLINTRYTSIESTFRDMVRVKMDDTRLAAYLKLVFPEPHDPKDERAAEQVWKIRKSATFLFVNGKGNRLGAVAGTLWAAYNGVAELIDHGPTSRKPAQQSEIHLVRQRRRN